MSVINLLKGAIRVYYEGDMEETNGLMSNEPKSNLYHIDDCSTIKFEQAGNSINENVIEDDEDRDDRKYKNKVIMNNSSTKNSRLAIKSKFASRNKLPFFPTNCSFSFVSAIIPRENPVYKRIQNIMNQLKRKLMFDRSLLGTQIYIFNYKNYYEILVDSEPQVRKVGFHGGWESDGVIIDEDQNDLAEVLNFLYNDTGRPSGIKIPSSDVITSKGSVYIVHIH